MLPLRGAWVQSLVRELRFHILLGVDKKKKQKKTLQTTLLEAYWIHPSVFLASLVAQMVKNLPVMRETRV